LALGRQDPHQLKANVGPCFDLFKSLTSTGLLKKTVLNKQKKDQKMDTKKKNAFAERAAWSSPPR
jgi:hypothetical protein